MSNALFASDLALILRDGAGMASPMTSGAVMATGILGVASETFTTQSQLSVIQGETWTAIYAPTDFAAAPIVNGGVISFGADRFMVRHIDNMADGLHAKAYMEKLP